MTFPSLHTTPEPVYTSTEIFFLAGGIYPDNIMASPNNKSRVSSPQTSKDIIIITKDHLKHHKTQNRQYTRTPVSQVNTTAPTHKMAAGLTYAPLMPASPAQFTNRISADKSSWYHKRLTNLILDIKVMPPHH